MSVGPACGWTLLRGVLIAIAMLPIAVWLCGFLETLRGDRRRAAWCALLAPFLVPELLVGYAYANIPLDWRIQSSVLNELFYSLLVALRVLPVGVVTLYFAPPSALSREALHCRRLAFQNNTGNLQRRAGLVFYWLQGQSRAILPAAAVMFLLVFQDFELASRFEVNSIPATWTVKIYDAHVGGLQIGESMRLSLLPVCLELAIMVPVILLVVKSWNVAALSHRGGRVVGRVGQAAGWCYLLLSFSLVCVIPALHVFRNAADGLRVFAGDFVRKGKVPFQSEILTSALFAVGAGIGAAWIASMLLGRIRQSRRPMTTTLFSMLGSVPGLVGVLVLSLVVLALVQLPGLSFFYRNSLPLNVERAITSLPLLVTLALWLVPRAVLLKLLLQAASPREPIHAATMLAQSNEESTRGASRGLLWQMQTRGRFWTLALLCYWAYWDLTAPSILMPVGMVAAPVRLYNFMHYSQTAMLSAMLCVTMAFPVVVLMLLGILQRPVLRWFYR